MKAAVLREYGQTPAVEDVELGEPGPGEVAVQIGAAGVCRSDLSALEGHLPVPLPTILGHEAAGTVEQVGPGVRRVKPGDHVVLCWVPTCGVCFYCRSGLPHLCEAIVEHVASGRAARYRRGDEAIYQFAGVSAFAERTVVTESGCIPIPADVPFEHACLIGCAVATGVGAAVNTAKVRPGESVAVFGAGGVGLNVIQGAALCGAGMVIAVDAAEAKLALARRFGATHTVGAAQDPVVAIRELTEGRGVDCSFEVVGEPELIVAAYSAVRRGGRAVIVGVPAAGAAISLPAPSFPLEEKALMGSLYGSTNMGRDVPRLVDLYRVGKLELGALVSRTFPLEALGDACAALERGEVARAVVVPA